MECDSENYTISCGIFSAIPKQFGNRFKETGITAKTGHVHKTFLLGTARTVRFLKSKTAGHGLILRKFSSVVLFYCVLAQ